MPRLDPFRALEDSPAYPGHHSYRSGFWGLARIAGPRPTGTCRVALRAELDGGAVAVAELGSVEIEPTRRQLSPIGSTKAHAGASPSAWRPTTLRWSSSTTSSRRSATRRHANWICLISDDCSTPDRHGDPGRDGGRRALQRLASAATPGLLRELRAGARWRPRDAFVALADQDDRWHPDKLETLLAAIGDAAARLQRRSRRGPGRELLSDTYWSARRNNHADLLSLLVANSVTGAASLMRRDLLDYALPFPPAQFAHFHDHWLGPGALALGEIEFVERPLYDYVQHGEASLGHAAANQTTPLRERHRGISAPRASACASGAALLRRRLPADAVRDHPRASLPGAHDAAKRRALSRFLEPTDRRSRWRGWGSAARRPARRPGDARRRVDAVLRASPGGGCSRRARASGRSAGCGSTRAPALRSRDPAGRVPTSSRRDRGQDRPAAVRRRERRAAPDQPADSDDRPRPLLRRLHREAQPRPPARRGGCASPAS